VSRMMILSARAGGIPGLDSFAGVPRKTAQQADFFVYGSQGLRRDGDAYISRLLNRRKTRGA